MAFARIRICLGLLNDLRRWHRGDAQHGGIIAVLAFGFYIGQSAHEGGSYAPALLSWRSASHAHSPRRAVATELCSPS